MSEHVEFLRGVADRADRGEFPDTAAGLRRAADELERLQNELLDLRREALIHALRMNDDGSLARHVDEAIGKLRKKGE